MRALTLSYYRIHICAHSQTLSMCCFLRWIVCVLTATLKYGPCAETYGLYIFFLIDKSNCIYFLACLPPSECILYTIFIYAAMISSRKTYGFFNDMQCFVLVFLNHLFGFELNMFCFYAFEKLCCVYCFTVCQQKQQLTKFGGYFFRVFVIWRKKNDQPFTFLSSTSGECKACRLLEVAFHRNKITITVSYFNPIWWNNTYKTSNRNACVCIPSECALSTSCVVISYLFQFLNPYLSIQLTETWIPRTNSSINCFNSKRFILFVDSIIGLIRFDSRIHFTPNNFPHIYQEQEVSTIFHHHFYFIGDIFQWPVLRCI